jgi:short-subunit dehydrogenase
MSQSERNVQAGTSAGTVWITGGGTGIGRCLALGLSQRGYRVVISGRHLEKLQAVAAEAGDGIILPKTVDVTERETLDKVVAEIEAEWGLIEMAVLNAGDYTPMGLDSFDAELFRRLIEVNYLGVINCMQALLPGMLGRQGGEILITASLSGYRGLPKAAPYGASKAALISMAESLQPELKKRGVNLRLINPGFVRSALTDKNDFEMPFLISAEQAAQEILKRLPRKGFEIAFPTPFVAILKFMRCLPYRLYFRFMQRMVK